MFAQPPFLSSTLLASGILAGTTLLTQPACAEGCRVKLEGTEDAGWLAAARALDTDLATHGAPGRCTTVTVHIHPERARLVFVTPDGRRAERELSHPIELVPTVQALSVAGPVQAEPEQNVSRTPPRPRAPKPVTQETPDAALGAYERQDPSEPYALHPIFGAHFGFRAGADYLISPMLGGSAALMLGSWELGLVGRYEAHYVNARGKENDDRPDTSGATLGATVGVRKALGPLALRGGGMVLLAALHEDSGSKAGRAEARLGAYLGGLMPIAKTTRLRLDLGGELVPYNIGRSERNALEESSLPWWALTLALGAEFG